MRRIVCFVMLILTGLCHGQAISSVQRYMRPGTSVEAVLSLSAPVSVPTTVSLYRTDARITIPTSVTIPANTPSAVFSISRGLNTGGRDRVQVVASFNTGYRALDLTLLDDADSSVQGLRTESLPGAALVEWDGLPFDARRSPSPGFGDYHSRYIVYRRLLGGVSSQVGSAVSGSAFLDTTAQVGTNYEYQVCERRWSSMDVGCSSWVVGAPATAGSQAVWTSSPISTNGRLTGAIQWIGHKSFKGKLYFNGDEVGSFVPDKGYSGPADVATLSLSGKRLREYGKSTVSVTAVLEQGSERILLPAIQVALTTSPLTIEKVDDFMDRTKSEVSSYKLTYSGATAWSAEIRDVVGNLRNFSGSGSTAEFTWNGYVNGGGLAQSGQALATITFSHPSGAKSYGASNFVARGVPRFLGLINAVSSDKIDEMQAYGQTIRAKVLPCYGNDANAVWVVNGHYRYVADDEDEAVDEMSDHYRQLLIRAFVNHVEDFYFYGHGSDTDFEFGDINFSSLQNPNAQAISGNDINVWKLGKIFNVVWLDMCNSAGPVNNAADPGNVSWSWPVAFRILSSGGFIGYNGYTRGFRISGHVTNFQSVWSAWSQHL